MSDLHVRRLMPVNRVMVLTIFFVLFAPLCGGMVEEVRLAGGGRRDEGRVEVKMEGEWGTVCDDGWNHQNARVVCRMLNMPGGMAFAGAYFGQGSGRILLDSVGCHGDEDTLNQCVLALPDEATPTCGHHEDAGVRCGPDPLGGELGLLDAQGALPGVLTPSPLQPLVPNCAEGGQGSGNVRLVGSEETPSAGYVQIRDPSQGLQEFGYVCDDLWNLQNARVVCRELCFQDSEAQPGWHRPLTLQPPARPRIVLDQVRCDGEESSLLLCRHLPLFVHDCSPTELAGVTCASLTQTPQVPRPEVDCQADRMVVTFRKADNPRLRKDAIAMGEGQPPSCSPAVAEDGGRVVVVLLYDRCCHLQQSAEGNLTYTTSLLVPTTQPPSPITGMSRVTEYKIEVECVMASQYHASRRLPQVALPVLPASGEAALQITMTMYQDDTFTKPAVGQGVVLAPGGWVNLGLELQTADDRFVLVVTSCSAGPNLTDPAAPQQSLLQNKCVQEETVSMYTISDTFWGLRFQPFSFDNYPDVTIECAAYACKNDAISESCDRSCNAASIKYKTNGELSEPVRRRRRRKSGSGRRLYTLSRTLTYQRHTPQ